MNQDDAAAPLFDMSPKGRCHAEKTLRCEKLGCILAFGPVPAGFTPIPVASWGSKKGGLRRLHRDFRTAEVPSLCRYLNPRKAKISFTSLKTRSESILPCEEPGAGRRVRMEMLMVNEPAVAFRSSFARAKIYLPAQGTQGIVRGASCL
ncbi:hypothetical protein VDGL01_03567 [Verticillium dahliae]